MTPQNPADPSRERPPRAIPERFHVLDVGRGIAALAVVFHHWVHFFPGDFRKQSQPFFAQLALLYEHGNVAVDFFFALSGFIFYWLYSSRIASGKVSAKDFAVYRLSRLYPLHLATLLIVLALQSLYLSRHGSYFVYQFNDLRHFVLSAAFASAWGMTPEWSFNGPSWSISVEVLLYILFFVFCRLRARSWWQLVGFAVLGRVIMMSPANLVGRGMLAFFLGGVVFLVYERLLKARHFVAIARLVIVVAMAGWCVAIGEVQSGRLAEVLPTSLLRMGFIAFVIPMTVLAMVLLETLGGAFARHFAFLGEISYSTYLIHFPLQLVFAIGADALGYGPDVFYRPSTLFLFFAALIPLSLASFHGFEGPAQTWLRRLYKSGSGRRPAIALAPALPRRTSTEEVA